MDPNIFKVTIEEKRKLLEKLNEKEVIIEEKILTKEERKAIEDLKEARRRQAVFTFFQVFTEREMTEEEYKKYIEIYDNPRTRRGYNILNFINGDDGKEFLKEDVNQQA